MPATLPIDPGTGKLVPFDEDAIEAMGIKRRGVLEGDHVVYNFGPDGSGCTRKFSCEWSERYNAKVYFVGAAVSYVETSERKISRLVPQRDPDHTNWIATKCEITDHKFTGEIETPGEGSEPYPEHERADLLVTYELVPYEVKSDEETEGDESLRYVTRPGYPGAEVSTDAQYLGLLGSIMQYTIPGGGANKPQGVPIPYPVGFTEPMRKIAFVWRRVPRDCWGPEAGTNANLFRRVIGSETAQGILGAVNKTTFLGMWSTTLLLISVEDQLLPDPTGLDYAWDLKFICQHKPVPYGHLGFYYNSLDASPPNVSGYYQALRPNAASGGTIDDPATIADGQAMLPVREFDDLFKITV